MARGRPGEDELLFPRAEGKPWAHDDWNNWRDRCFVPALEAIGVTGVVPYDLRHSFCSLLIHEGTSVVEVAAHAGHAATMTLSTYAHVFEELAGSARLDAEGQIKAARAAEVPVSYPEAVGSNLSNQRKAESPKCTPSPQADARTRTGDPFITSRSFAGIFRFKAPD